MFVAHFSPGLFIFIYSSSKGSSYIQKMRTSNVTGIATIFPQIIHFSYEFKGEP